MRAWLSGLGSMVVVDDSRLRSEEDLVEGDEVMFGTGEALVELEDGIVESIVDLGMDEG